MNYLYIISGPNGAGKTTASFTILPEILMTLYLPVCDNWIILNGQGADPEVIAYKAITEKEQIINKNGWESILKQCKQ